MMKMSLGARVFFYFKNKKKRRKSFGRHSKKPRPVNAGDVNMAL
jgi:hypothetical protein